VADGQHRLLAIIKARATLPMMVTYGLEKESSLGIDYHRPRSITAPEDVTCTIYTKKIKRQKSVGRVGWMDCEYDRMKRRFMFDGTDPMDALLNNHRAGFTPLSTKIPQEFWDN
jgi:hypothetical protein